MKISTLMMAVLMAATTTAQAASAADLTVTFDNIKESSGTIMIALYQGKEAFLAPGGAIAYGRVGAADVPAGYTFTDLAPGDYAISAFHDVDGDGKLKKNHFGAPREPYGMSRDARGVMGPPAYEDAVFTVPAEGGSQRITLD